MRRVHLTLLVASRIAWGTTLVAEFVSTLLIRLREVMRQAAFLTIIIITLFSY